MDLNPCLPTALTFLGYLKHMIGHPPQESIDYWNAGRYEEGLAVSRRLVALLPDYYFGYLWGALNAVGLGLIDDARDLIRQARQVQPALSMALIRRSLGAMATDVDRRMAAALGEAGVE